MLSTRYIDWYILEKSTGILCEEFPISADILKNLHPEILKKKNLNPIIFVSEISEKKDEAKFMEKNYFATVKLGAN